MTLDHERWADNAAALLIAANLCAGNVTRNRDTPSQDDELPTADVFIGEDNARSSSRAGNQGYLQFEHTAKLGIEIRRAENDGVAARAALVIDVGIVMDTLLRRFFEWADDAEGCTGYRVAYLTATEGTYTEARAAISIDIASHSGWPAPDAGLPDFTSTSVDAGNGLGSIIPRP